MKQYETPLLLIVCFEQDIVTESGGFVKEGEDLDFWD